jgi:hypothetical protein
MPHVARLAFMVVVICGLAACDLVGLRGPTGGRYPDACESLDFPARQCEAIVAVAQANASIAPETVASIDILPPSSQGGGLVGRRMVAEVRFHRSNQPDQTEEVWCPGVSRDNAFACDPDARIGIYGRIDRDVPCTGEPPEGCATLPPSPRPAVQAIARPLRVPSLDIPLDHLGSYEVAVGEAGLPDGALSTLSATLAEPNPETFWIAERIHIDVRPVDPGRPPVGSVYREAFDGVEPVKVFLVFDVTELKSPSVLQVRDLVVE